MRTELFTHVIYTFAAEYIPVYWIFSKFISTLIFNTTMSGELTFEKFDPCALKSWRGLCSPATSKYAGGEIRYRQHWCVREEWWRMGEGGVCGRGGTG